MSKTGKKCEICGIQPAYYSKRTRRVLCKNHTIEILLKLLFASGIVIGAIAIFF
jgi:hypothetical protein